MTPKRDNIDRIDIFQKTLHFRQSFRVAYEELDRADVIFLRLTDAAGNFGWGSAFPDREVTKETEKIIYLALRRFLKKEFFSFPLDQIYRYHEKLKQVFSKLPAGRSIVEEALLNLRANRLGIDLRYIFGGYRNEASMIFSIGIKDLRQTVAEVCQRAKQGFKTFKLKCGLDLEGDVERVRRVRQSLPKTCAIIADANQGYSLPQAARFIKAIKKYDVGLIEQPVGASDLAGLRTLTKLRILPVIADESLLNFSDAVRLLTGNYVDGVNIKMQKCGGPIASAEIFHLARCLGKITMLGCNFESNISITTAASLALALPFDYVDLDSGHLDFIDDPTFGGVRVSRGKISIAGKIGVKGYE